MLKLIINAVLGPAEIYSTDYPRFSVLQYRHASRKIDTTVFFAVKLNIHYIKYLIIK